MTDSIVHESFQAPARSQESANDLTCEICGAQMIQRQCKITCPNCGFTRDCSDP